MATCISLPLALSVVSVLSIGIIFFGKIELVHVPVVFLFFATTVGLFFNHKFNRPCVIIEEERLKFPQTIGEISIARNDIERIVSRNGYAAILLNSKAIERYWKLEKIDPFSISNMIISVERKGWKYDMFWVGKPIRYYDQSIYIHLESISENDKKELLAVCKHGANK